VSVLFVVKAKLNANFVSEGVSSFFSLWQSIDFFSLWKSNFSAIFIFKEDSSSFSLWFFRYGSKILTPFSFSKKILLPFCFGKVLDFFVVKA
jgi:hypothetical protein